MSRADLRAFLQARMSSRRLPGKVMEPIAGRPMYLHVFERVASVVGRDRTHVLTSTDASDDPLCRDLETRKIPYYRGALDDVASRFAEAARKLPAEWYARISCDSPLISTATLRSMVDAIDERYDLITNTYPRSFPKGQSIEILRRPVLERLGSASLSAEQREHVTPFVYENASEFRIRNVSNPNGDESSRSDVVDTPEDLERAKRRLEAEA